jgi:hypothetical protein
MRAVAPAAFVLTERLAIQSLGFPDRFDVAQGLGLVAGAAHELIRLGPVPGQGRGMFGDEVFVGAAAFDAANAVLLVEESAILARREIGADLGANHSSMENERAQNVCDGRNVSAMPSAP